MSLQKDILKRLDELEEKIPGSTDNDNGVDEDVVEKLGDDFVTLREDVEYLAEENDKKAERIDALENVVTEIGERVEELEAELEADDSDE